MLWGCVEPEKQMKSSLQHEHCNEAQPAWRIGREPRTVYCTSGHLSNGDGVDSLSMDGLVFGCVEDLNKILRCVGRKICKNPPGGISP